MKSCSIPIFLALWLTAVSAVAGTTISVKAGTSNFEFGFLYSDHYHTDESVVHHYIERLDEPDFVVALHLSRVSGIELKVIVDWRQNGISWHEITYRCHKGPEVFYVELEGDPGPPYGRAHGHWKKHPKRQIVLSDDEIRAFAVLKVMSDYTGQSAAYIVAERKLGRSPGAIATASKRIKQQSVEDASAPVPNRQKAAGKSNGKSNGKNKKK